jgi:SAM-dependent methyltransferase
VLDLGSGSGEMLCTWARDHGIVGTGIDMSQLFTEQAKLRAEELGVADQVKFIHGDAAGHVSDEKVDVAACIGATWIAGGVAGTIELLAQSLRTGGIILIGEPYWRQLPPTEDIAKDVLPTQSPTSSPFQNFSRLSATSATTSWKWFWLTKTAGTDTRRPNGSPCADGLKPIPTTSWRKRFAPN